MAIMKCIMSWRWLCSECYRVGDSRCRVALEGSTSAKTNRDVDYFLNTSFQCVIVIQPHHFYVQQWIRVGWSAKEARDAEHACMEFDQLADLRCSGRLETFVPLEADISSRSGRNDNNECLQSKLVWWSWREKWLNLWVIFSRTVDIRAKHWSDGWLHARSVQKRLQW